MKRALTRVPITAGVARRFVAGESRVDLAPVVRDLLASGRMVSVDLLGEHTTERSMADDAVTEYLALIDDLAAWDGSGSGSVRRVEVSVKLSALGQALGEAGPEIATTNLRTLCLRAAEAGVWVSVDAEDHTTTDATLDTVRRLRGEFPWLAVAVQTYLRRAETECRELASLGARIRLCKGAYREPEEVAYQRRADVDSSYLRCLDVVMRGAGYSMVATHDPDMIAAAARFALENGLGAGQFEFQMLYGVRDGEQRRLAGAGHAVRVYVPYGNQWYGYLMRRLAERPANLGFFLRALAEKRSGT
ncbi:proline dehydrogenase family protein [Nocardia sp. CDC159]|uniref:proline dehydrogenase n=1 Tax=Nocardia pulmonis TaxID=2951408 RepID=A0A9X2E7U9_9NOCA|nr:MULTISPECIES: proline dehydrogenase family protein [Nocardia]MCM6775874.1 proline dehydrogenase family protein [Nocardia pulmonis]MCM6788150.1 proline dehydrogenase family protein [Nocardia sp. CDC159]